MQLNVDLTTHTSNIALDALVVIKCECICIYCKDLYTYIYTVYILDLWKWKCEKVTTPI